jgi:hypothetical protein
MKTAICNFCRRSFRNTQAVRAHLKACPAYARLPKATLPRVGSKPRMVGTPDRCPDVRPNWATGLQPTSPRSQAPRIVAGTGQKANLSGIARWMIQSVKDEVIGSWWSPGHTITSEAKAEALVAIDQKLARLPVDQLPRAELVTIAEGIRDRIYRPAIQAQQRAREKATAPAGPAADDPHHRWGHPCEPGPSSAARPGELDPARPRAEGEAGGRTGH